MINDEITHKKSIIRKTIMVSRDRLSAPERELFAEKICSQILTLQEINLARSIFIYISFSNEVNTHKLIDILQKTGKQLCVPKIINSDYMIAVPFESWDELKPGELGILTPLTSKKFNGKIDVSITPGLAFTKHGHRLGFGRGYYDKWFAQHDVRHKIALAYESQLVNKLPVNQNDISMDMIITEKDIYQLSID